MGFKLGEGKFRAFTFDTPNYLSNHNMGIEQLKKSEIKVEFFKTKQRLLSGAEIMKRSIRKAEGKSICQEKVDENRQLCTWRYQRGQKVL